MSTDEHQKPYMAHQATRRNLDDVFSRVANGELQWSSPAQFRAAIAELSQRLPGGRLDWDEGAGEEWARVLDGDRPVAIVLSRGRVIFLAETCAECSASVLDPLHAVLELVNDFDVEAFEVDEKMLRRALGRVALSSELDYGSLSVTDLWWATV